MIRFLSLIAIVFFSIQISTAQELTMFSSFGGYKYYIDDKPVSKEEVKSLMAQYPEVKSEWNKSSKSLTAAYVFLGAEVGFGVWMLSKGRSTEGIKDVALPYAGFMTCAIGSIIYSLKANKHKKNSVLLYNRRATASYKITPSKNGLGLCLNF